MTTAQLKQTPLATAHKKLGARMVDFAGWFMPVQYKSIVAEHTAVRTKVGIFDVSHMGEFLVQGAGAADFVQRMVANDLAKLTSPNMALYTQLCNDNGGTVDDLIVYRLETGFMLVVNASNIEKDWNWLSLHATSSADVKMTDLSDHMSLLALQGPDAIALMASLAGDDVRNIPSFCYGEGTIGGVKASWGRTGYTGEDGFEIFIDADKVEAVWNTLLEKGQEYGIEPCGLGARDTLRLEAALPLYGHELDDTTGPLEAGLGWSVKLEKGDFAGSDALKKQKSEGLKKQMVCLRTDAKALPRQGYAVFDGDTKIGVVTSGSQGIILGHPIACAYVPPAHAKVGTRLAVEIRETKVPAQVVRRPFYKRKG